MYPCVRESLLTAFGGGFAVGGVRALLGGMSAIHLRSRRWTLMFLQHQ